MYLVHYDPTTYQVLGYLDPTQGIYTEEDGTAYFSIDDEIHTKYSGDTAWTDGKIITNIAPPNDFATLTAGGWVIDEHLKKQALVDAKAQAKDNIDNAVVSIYQKFNPFQQEYALREKQALEFSRANYEGVVPQQVQAVATPTGMTAKEATDSILAASIKLQKALEKLGELRMQKPAVDSMSTMDEVKAHETQVINQIKILADEL